MPPPGRVPLTAVQGAHTAYSKPHANVAATASPRPTWQTSFWQTWLSPSHTQSRLPSAAQPLSPMLQLGCMQGHGERGRQWSAVCPSKHVLRSATGAGLGCSSAPNLLVHILQLAGTPKNACSSYNADVVRPALERPGRAAAVRTLAAAGLAGVAHSAGSLAICADGIGLQEQWRQVQHVSRRCELNGRKTKI